MTGNSSNRVNSVRFGQIRRLAGAINNLGQHIAQRLGKRNAHSQPRDNGNLGGIGAVHLAAAQRQVHDPEIVPVLKDEVGKYGCQGVGENGEFCLAYRQYLARLHANLINHIPLPGPELLAPANNNLNNDLAALSAQNFALNSSGALGLMSQQAFGAPSSKPRRSWLARILHWLTAEPTRIPTLLLGLCVAGMWFSTGHL